MRLHNEGASMKRHRARALAGLVAAIVGLGALLLPAPAMAWGNHTHCKGHAFVGHTNRWTPFAAHHMDVNLHACLTSGTRSVPPHLIWTKKPRITYPDRFAGGSIIESVTTTVSPFVEAVHRDNGVVTRVKYRWEVKQCSLIKTVLCSHIDFQVAYLLPGSRICIVGGKKCDSLKFW